MIGRGMPTSQSSAPFRDINIIPTSRRAWTTVRRNFGSLCHGFLVHALAKRHGVELRVGCLLLVEISRQETNDVVVAEFFGPGDQRAVSRDLVMFDRLRTRYDGGVEHGLVVDLARDRVGFLDQAVDRRTVGRLGASTALARN